MAKEDLIVGLDIGTTKICAVIAEIGTSRRLEIVGVGTSPCKGLRKGDVVDLDSTVTSIEKAVNDAELMAGVEVSSAFVGVAGGHIKGLNSHGVIAISRRGEVIPSDVERVIDAAKAVAIPVDQKVIHIIPQQYIVDGQDGVRDPVGFSGVRLEAEVHIITGSITSIQNITKCVTRAGFDVDDIVLESLAAAASVLTEDEKDLGVVLIDIGGGTSDIIMFIEGSVWHTGVLRVGGSNVTRDLSVGLRTPIDDAEKIKIEYGCCDSSLVGDDETVDVPSVGGRSSRKLPRQILCDIIQPRMEEIFSLISREIKMTGYENLIGAGAVLTGGAVLMEGTQELAEKILNLPVRIGYPRGVSGLVDVVNSPLYATGTGIVRYGARHRMNSKSGRSEKGLLRGLKRLAKAWLGELF